MTQIVPTNLSTLSNFQTVAQTHFSEGLPNFKSINISRENFSENLTAPSITNYNVFLESLRFPDHERPKSGYNTGPAKYFSTRKSSQQSAYSRTISKSRTSFSPPSRTFRQRSTVKSTKQSSNMSSNSTKRNSSMSFAHDSSRNGHSTNRRTNRIGMSSTSINSTTLKSLSVLWTAVSFALGAEVEGELVSGLPCITRFNQLFCRSGGTTYPMDKIERFIDDNKALIRRMHGEFGSSSKPSEGNQASRRRKRDTFSKDKRTANIFNKTGFSFPNNDFLEDDLYEGRFLLQDSSQSHSANNPYVNIIRRKKRQVRKSFRRASSSSLPNAIRERKDVCKSNEEVTTPYWASNSQGKILAIVNNKDFSQIIHQEICSQETTPRCQNDCGCEQKYKYHRLMAYDPENECKGIFMDWFLFPSCCSCRCDSV